MAIASLMGLGVSGLLFAAPIATELWASATQWGWQSHSPGRAQREPESSLQGSREGGYWSHPREEQLRE